MSIIVNCLWCRKEVVAQRRNRKKFCSNVCASRHRTGFPRQRTCLQCGATFPVLTRGDANRQHCSRVCAKKRYAKKIRTWQTEHPEAMKGYRKTQLAKNPGMYKDKARKDRLEAIRLLEGCCVVCGVTNTNWLHVDYIPTNKASPFRHPRHLRFVRDHLKDFRLLCANHHYELTLTGRIEGTEITQ